MRGDTTNAIPPRTTAGAWKHSDLPPPVEPRYAECAAQRSAVRLAATAVAAHRADRRAARRKDAADAQRHRCDRRAGTVAHLPERSRKHLRAPLSHGAPGASRRGVRASRSAGGFQAAARLVIVIYQMNGT